MNFLLDPPFHPGSGKKSVLRMQNATLVAPIWKFAGERCSIVHFNNGA
jgi:hypothetical protein